MEQSTLFVVIFLLVVLFAIFLNSSEDLSNVTFDLSETGIVRVQNDQMKVHASVESKLLENPNKSLEQITGTVGDIKRMLEENEQIRDIEIHTATQQMFDYLKDGKRRSKGFKAVSNISFNVTIKGDEQTQKASDIQKIVSNMSTDSVKVLIDSVEYFVSDEYRAELEGFALRDAIQKGKASARILMMNTYPDRDYRISNITIRNSSQYGPIGPIFRQARSLEASDTQNNIVSQGESTVTTIIDMKIQVV